MAVDIFEDIKKISPMELEHAGIIRRAKKTVGGYATYICKECGNGGGSDGDGLTVTKYGWGYNYRCFKEGKNYTAVDLLTVHWGIKDKKKLAERAREEFGLRADSYSFTENKKVAAPMSEQVAEPQRDYGEFYQHVQNQLAEFLKSTGGKFRGLMYEDLHAVGAGIATTADLKAVGENIPACCRCLILPHNSHRFLMRSISDNPKIKRGNTGGKKREIYNPYGVNFESAFFVVEGEIDAISIHKAGYPAIALSGAGEYRLLIKSLEEMRNKPAVRAIVMFDNNDGGAGQKDATAAITGLLGAGYKAINFILSPTEKYDANEFLQKDFLGFQERLKEIYSQANEEFEKMTVENAGSETLMEGTGIEKLADVFDDLDEMAEKLKGKLLKWGFAKLDEKLPMLPGCYLLGALPSLGKTTFALNICANICEQGGKILYISYEPTARQIAVKDLAGYWFRKIWNNHRDNRSPELVPTATQMMLEKYNAVYGMEEMKAVREELKSKRNNFYFLQGRKETAQDLISKVKPYVDSGVKFIVIDYIQLIKGDDSKTIREQIDETIHELQIFQSENDLVILFISAFNRENYRNYACIESFKESGGLEYTADAILALQFEYSSGESRGNIEKFQEKKQSRPRDVELICLKNRFGIDFIDRFSYHSAHETFIEKIDCNEKIADDEVDED